MFRPQPFKSGIIRPPINNMKFAGNLKAPMPGVTQVYQQVAQATNRAKNSIERLKR